MIPRMSPGPSLMGMNCRTVIAAVAIAGSLWGGGALAHNGLTVAHSPPAAHPVPGDPCASDDPLALFLLADPLIGGPIVDGTRQPAEDTDVALLAHVAISGVLARPEFGGYVYSGDIPGLHFADATNPCHAVTTAFTGGTPFKVFLHRSGFPSAAQMGIVNEFGARLLAADGAEYEFGNQTGAHFHPVWLLRRAGVYAGEFQLTSDVFADSPPFSLRFGTTACWEAVPVDLSAVYNADVVDSGAGDTPLTFDGSGKSWLLSGVYGAARGLPADGVLDVFELGGPQGAGLAGSSANCLFDDGVRTSAAILDLTTDKLADQYESVELLVAASGTFTSSHQLVVRLGYATGATQVVNLRRAAVAPQFFPLLDWRIAGAPFPELAVGRAGDASGGGFVRSTGTAVDDSVVPSDSMYFTRVTFPVDPLRELRTITFDDYTGAGRVGVFAVTLIRIVAYAADLNGDGLVGLPDAAIMSDCAGDPYRPIANQACRRGDVECDDDIDLRDFASFQNDFGS